MFRHIQILIGILLLFTGGLLQAPSIMPLYYALYSESNEEKSSAPSTYTVGERIKVLYGKGKFLKSYVAKVSSIYTLYNDSAYDMA